MLMLMTKRRCQSPRSSSGHLNNYILIAFRESLEANLCLNKVKCHSLWGLKPEVGASPHVACDTNPGAFVQVLPALGWDQVQNLKSVSRLRITAACVWGLPWVTGCVMTYSSAASLSLHFNSIFGSGQWKRGRCCWRYNNLMRVEGSSKSVVSVWAQSHCLTVDPGENPAKACRLRT